VPAFTLLHSPLVGPLTWSPVSEELRRRGQRVAVPALSRTVVTGGWQAYVHAAVEGACSGAHDGVLVGHSGAGPLLPLVARDIHPPPVRVVFVDAGVPPLSGEAQLMPDQFLDFLQTLARDGVLPKWSEWFGPEAMEALIPDAKQRRAVTAELPELPVSYFAGAVPMPSRWDDIRCAYILLSDPYRSDALEATSRGWPVIEMPGAHLDILTRPAEIADALLELAAS
jgi:hypothetical protein